MLVKNFTMLGYFEMFRNFVQSSSYNHKIMVVMDDDSVCMIGYDLDT